MMMIVAEKNLHIRPQEKRGKVFKDRERKSYYTNHFIPFIYSCLSLPHSIFSIAGA